MVTVRRRAEFVHHAYKENMAIFVKKIVSVIVAIAVYKKRVYVKAVQTENTECTVITAVPKTVKEKSVKETQENVVNVKLDLWEKIVWNRVLLTVRSVLKMDSNVRNVKMDGMAKIVRNVARNLVEEIRRVILKEECVTFAM